MILVIYEDVEGDCWLVGVNDLVRLLPFLLRLKWLLQYSCGDVVFEKVNEIYN
jgi:hypothetical protein